MHHQITKAEILPEETTTEEEGEIEGQNRGRLDFMNLRCILLVLIFLELNYPKEKDFKKKKKLELNFQIQLK